MADKPELRVGFLRGSTTEAVLDRELTNTGIEPASVKREKLSYEEAMEALRTGATPSAPEAPNKGIGSRAAAVKPAGGPAPPSATYSCIT
jgi:hypothetical protein